MNQYQRVFNDFWNHFIIEKKPFGILRKFNGSCKADQKCSYVAGCAIGYRMSRDLAERAEHYGTFADLPYQIQEEYFKIVGLPRNDDSIKFASRLQTIHDNLASIGNIDHIDDLCAYLGGLVKLPDNYRAELEARMH